MAKEESSGKLLAALSYFSIVGLIILLIEKKNKFVVFHAKQGTALFALELLIGIIAAIPIISIMASILGLAAFIVSVYGIILALTGKKTIIPLVSDLGDKIAKLLGQ